MWKTVKQYKYNSLVLNNFKYNGIYKKFIVIIYIVFIICIGSIFKNE